MKILLVGLTLFISMGAFAVEVCQVTAPTNGTQGKVLSVCTNETDSYESDYKFDYTNLKDAQLTKAKVEHMKRLIQKGYEIKTNSIFIKN